MGYLLKEALKTLCGVNQWSYAVFWKIGCQNPKLLIWEECYCKSDSCPGLSGISGNGIPGISQTCDLQSSVSAGDRVNCLVNKMMMENHVNIVGEGLVGRVAFTESHKWILSENFYGEVHPPEVLKEVCQQFSAGMQTVTVIPVLPHGVVQFGSYMKLAENMGFIDNVLSLVLQLGYVPGVWPSQNYAANELTSDIGVPACHGYSTHGGLPLESNEMGASSITGDSFNHIGCSAQTSVLNNQLAHTLTGEIQNEMQSSFAVFQPSSSSSHHLKLTPAVKLDFALRNQFMNGVAKAEVIPSNSDMCMNQHSSLHAPGSIKDSSCSSSSNLNNGSIRCMEQRFMSNYGIQGTPIITTPTGTMMSAVRTNSGLISSSNEGSAGLPSLEANRLCQGASNIMKPVSDMDSLSDGNKAVSGNITTKCPSGLKNLNLSKIDYADHSMLTYCSGGEHYDVNKKYPQSELNPFNEEMKQNVIHEHVIPLNQQNENLNMAELIPGFDEDHMQHKTESQNQAVNYAHYNDASSKPQSGDDLFDILGADFKNRLFGSCWNSHSSNQSATSKFDWDKKKSPSKNGLVPPESYSTSQGNSDNGIFSLTGTDHLLDAVVSKVQPTNIQSLDDNVSCKTTLTNMSSSASPKASLPYGRFEICDRVKGESLDIPKYQAKAGAISSSSFRSAPSREDSGTYSQSSSIYDSCIRKVHNVRQNDRVSIGHSKKSHELSKTNRKRLKPGENPRPRPKDRQMIQDRLKELREIVPTGAKCSIDSLLERTIKHMLFLQGVRKHADKLKHVTESENISKDGGLLLKDNFEGGATWAYEVGSQSMVCPIIVEDLNQSHQMLVEMLCEESGMFLEIADIIRRLGLTILKGLMETRNDKIWARFSVEANREVTRMEVFLSLVRLLEHNGKGCVPQTNDIGNNNMMVPQFHQAASVPATGRSNSFN